MAKIIGNTTAMPNPKPDWNQTDENKADYIKNKPFTQVDSTVTQNSTNPVSGGAVKTYMDNVVTQATQLMDQKDQTAVNAITKFINENYVAKVTGKGLSTNDFNEVYKTKVDNAASTGYVDGLVGDIETVLDNIITVQNSYIGGAE